ncbi:MAG: hypothetical protein B6V02_02015, partial [Thermoprotei archaeon ex4572_64]
MAITINHKVYAVSLVTSKGVFIAQNIANTSYTVIITRNREVITLDSENYMRFLKAMTGLMREVSRMARSRYYTFLGEYQFQDDTRTLIYEPYVDLMKRVRIEINRSKVKIIFDSTVKKFKKTKTG